MKTQFSILCDVIFLVRVQEKFDQKLISDPRNCLRYPCVMLMPLMPQV